MSKRQPWKRIVERPKIHSIPPQDNERANFLRSLGGNSFRLVDVLECGHMRPGFFGVDHAPSRSPYRTDSAGQMWRRCDQCPRIEVEVGV